MLSIAEANNQPLRGILRIFSYFIMKMYVVCTHWNHLIEAILMSTLIILLLKIKIYP